MSVRKVSRGESLASPRKRRFSRTLPNFALITIVMILMMMMMVMMMMIIINYCRLTASEARNRRALNPLVELWREDLFITPEKQYTQALGCSSSECTSKGKSVFLSGQIRAKGNGSDFRSRGHEQESTLTQTGGQTGSSLQDQTFHT